MPAPISRPATSPCRRADSPSAGHRRSDLTPKSSITSPTAARRQGRGDTTTTPIGSRASTVLRRGRAERPSRRPRSTRKARQAPSGPRPPARRGGEGRQSDAITPQRAAVALPPSRARGTPILETLPPRPPSDPSPRHLSLSARRQRQIEQDTSLLKKITPQLRSSSPYRPAGGVGANGSQGERPGGRVVEGRWRPRPRRPLSHRASPTRTPTRREFVSQPSSSPAVPSETLPPGRSRQTPHSPPCRRADIADPTTLTPPVRPVRQPPRHRPPNHRDLLPQG